MDIYLEDGELEALVSETQGRLNSVGGQAAVHVALGTGRLLPWANGTYDQWVLLVLCELRGVELAPVQTARLADWRNGGRIGVAR